MSLYVNLISLIERTGPAQTKDQVLAKEAAYSAVGRSPSQLSTYVNFDQWLDGELMKEALDSEPQYVLFSF